MSKFFKKYDQQGIIHISTSKNNTIFTLTDLSGVTKFWISTGVLGFKNSRKSTTYAAQAAADQVAMKALSLGFSGVKIQVKGLGYGKDSCIRALANSRLTITTLVERTPVAHNGCRTPKKRRI
jgi:small subunit ribosomal protein S11